MKKRNRKQEKGVALLFVLLAIMLLSAIAVGMLYTASIETAVSSNFKSQEKAYFAARAGIEEMRERLLINDANTIAPPPVGFIYVQNGTDGFGNPIYNLNLKMPGTAPTGVIYITNGVTLADIATPPAPGAPNPFYDDELCHDYGQDPVNGMTWVPSNVPCTTQPLGNWATLVPSIFQSNNAAVNPFGATGAQAALEYKWVRVTWKQNASAEGDNPGSNLYWVDKTKPATWPVCWTGGAEVVIDPVAVGQCDKVPAPPNGNGPYGPVYIATALAVTSNVKNLPGIRRMVQMEIAQSPVVGASFGAFAVATSCSAMKFAGNASTGSFNSAGENPPTSPPSNLNTTTSAQGNIGSNGNTLLGGTSTNINGSVGAGGSSSQAVGACPDPLTTTGQPKVQGNQPGSVCPGPSCPISDIPTQTFPTPAAPNPMPPTTKKTINSSTTLAPGSYGNVSITGGSTVTLQGGTPGNPAVYTLNSLSLAGNSTLVITGPVVINFGGQGVTNVVDFTGGGFQNTTNVPGNFVLKYGGPTPCTAPCTPSPQSATGAIIAGGTQAYGIFDFPNANVTMKGGSNFYGQVVANTVDDQGGTNLYYDTALTAAPSWNSPFHLISLRELAY